MREVQVRVYIFHKRRGCPLTLPQEYFADYTPIIPPLFSLNHAPSSARPLYGSNANTWDPDALEKTAQGIIAVLLSLKKKPIIRYERMSGMAKKLGTEIHVCVLHNLYRLNSSFTHKHRTGYKVNLRSLILGSRR